MGTTTRVKNKDGFQVRYKNWALTPNNICPNLFDLARIQINQKTGKDYYRNMGWGMRFEDAVLKMVRSELHISGEKMELSDYIVAYQKASKELVYYLKKALSCNESKS